MSSVNFVAGSDGSNTLTGSPASDLIYGFNPDGPQSNITSISAQRIASGLSQPLFAASPPGDLERLFIVEKSGLIKVFDLATQQVLPTAFLSVTSQIAAGGEQGLLGLAFHPDYASNGFFYVNLINTNGDTEIRRYRVSSTDPNQADAASASLVITVDQPAGLTNHKAGWLDFGPDGYLYAALGDGGGAGDPHNNAQNLDSLLGKILRLDVNADAFPSDATRNYAVPSDNPFAAAAGAGEIWALGLRNPWRASFDRGLGEFYVADVGQDSWEEIDLGRPGANYGWDVREGPDAFDGGSSPAPIPFTEPIHFYGHDVGQSITGGYVYRGTSEGLQGRYFFADFVAGKVFTLHFDGSTWNAVDRTSQIMTDSGAINLPDSFGQDARGNLYLLDFDGDIYRLTPNVISADQSDVLSGMGGNDLLFGGSGDDTLDGGEGDDKLHGGRDDDTYFVDSARDLVIEELDEGVDTVHSSVTFRLGPNLENLVLGGGADISATGNAAANQLTGNSGRNVLNGGAGSDSADYQTSTGAVVAELWRGSASNDGQGGADSLVGLENLLGGAFNDLLAGDEGANNLRGNGGNDLLVSGGHADALAGEAGDDILRGGSGNDTLTGGAGIDTGDFSTAAAAVTAEIWRGNANIDGDGGVDTLVAIENLFGSVHNDLLAGDEDRNGLFGSSGNDLIVAGGADDSLNGEAGDDILRGGSGNDTLSGGTGIDTGDFSTAASAVRAEIWRGRADIDGDGGADTLAAIENLFGSAHNDFLAGDEGANGLFGNSGNDLVVGGGADDSLNGEAGNDILRGGGGNDTLSGGTGIDTGDFSTAVAAVAAEIWRNAASVDGDGGVDMLIAIENLFGSVHDDLLAGDESANSLYGNTGNDVLIGGGGADVFIGQGGNDTLTGGNGQDAFLFETALGASNVDQIADFSVADDTIQLAHTIFASFASPGSLPAGTFVSGPGQVTAADGDDLLIYDSTGGALYYDADGSGSGSSPVQFATLLGTPAVTDTNFLIV